MDLFSFDKLLALPWLGWHPCSYGLSCLLSCVLINSLIHSAGPRNICKASKMEQLICIANLFQWWRCVCPVLNFGVLNSSFCFQNEALRILHNSVLFSEGCPEHWPWAGCYRFMFFCIFYPSALRVLMCVQLCKCVSVCKTITPKRWIIHVLIYRYPFCMLLYTSCRCASVK